MDVDRFYSDKYQSVMDRFPDVSPGLQMLSRLKRVYLVRSGVTSTFFDTESGSKLIVCHEENVRHQVSVIKRYVKSILRNGNCQDVRGIAISQASKGGDPPYRMITYGTFSRSIYQAAKDHPDHPMVKLTLEAGLKMDVYSDKMPNDCVRYIRDYFNQFHSGSGTSFLEIFVNIHDMHNDWKGYADAHGIALSSNNKNFGDGQLKKWLDAHYKDLQLSTGLFNNAHSFKNTCQAKGWWNRFHETCGDLCDFVSPSLDNNYIIATLHAWSVICSSIEFKHIDPDILTEIFLIGAQFCYPQYAEDNEDTLTISSATKSGSGRDMLSWVKASMKGSAVATAKPKAKKSKQKDVQILVPDEEITEEFVWYTHARRGAHGKKPEERQRDRLWLDDMALMIMHVDNAFKSALEDKEYDTTSRSAIIRASLELCFFKTCDFNGKAFVVWSKLRPVVQEYYINALLQIVKRDTSQSADSVGDSLLSAVTADDEVDELHQQVCSMFASNAAKLQAFMIENPTDMPIGSQTTIASSTRALWSRISELTCANDSCDIAQYIELMIDFVEHAFDPTFHKMCALAGKVLGNSSAEVELSEMTSGLIPDVQTLYAMTTRRSQYCMHFLANHTIPKLSPTLSTFLSEKPNIRKAITTTELPNIDREDWVKFWGDLINAAAKDGNDGLVNEIKNKDNTDNDDSQNSQAIKIEAPSPACGRAKPQPVPSDATQTGTLLSLLSLFRFQQPATQMEFANDESVPFIEANVSFSLASLNVLLSVLNAELLNRTFRNYTHAAASPQLQVRQGFFKTAIGSWQTC